MSSTLDRPIAHAGRPTDRIDGPRKVTGTAPYAADADVRQPLHAVLVESSIARGRVRAIDETAARALPGIVEIMTFRNAPRVTQTGFSMPESIAYMEPHLMPLQNGDIMYWGQHIAVVIARTFEAARAGAEKLRIDYHVEANESELNDRTRATKERAEEFMGQPLNVERGNPDAALASAHATIDATYTTPEETHNALEPAATIASWSHGDLTVYDSTQWIVGTQKTLAHLFAIAPERVRVISPFVGGGFGSKGFIWPHIAIAAMAAKLTGDTVKLVVDRTQFFTSNGHRTPTEQRVRAGADAGGKMTALVHDVLTTTGRAGEWIEPCGGITPMLYDVPNVRVTHHLVRLDTSTPAPMRAPGESPGTFAIESALDELAYAANLDPLELRVRNHAVSDPSTQTPFSSKHLLECYTEGARRFGWSERNPQPRSMRDGREFIGYGMATATYPAMAGATSVRARLEPGGHVRIECATHDIGTGMYTIIAQVAADTLGIPLEHIDVRIGDSNFPAAPVAGGSQSTASVMPPLVAACRQLLDAAGGDLASAQPGLEVSANATGDVDDKHFSFHSFGAQFCEVRYDEELARVRVSRFTGVFDCGNVLNPKAARSQMMGGIIMGLGMALMEETIRDPRTGGIVTNNFADYRVPVNADIPPIDVGFVEFPDLTFNSLGVRGVGEIGITGVAAAVANAVYHASGRRVRDLPIVPEKLL